MPNISISEKFAAHFADCERTAKASVRAVRIVERVLPKLTNSHNPLADEFSGFLGASRRIGARQELYKAIYPRMLAKVESGK